MKVIKNLKYSKDHEWVKVEGNKAYIGITDYAQHALGDIVFVELPETDTEISGGDAFAVVESVKAAADVYSPVSGVVLEVNEELLDAPERINEDPYESWIALIELSDPDEVEELMDAVEYEKFCSEED
ncbi:MAG TPA: glycine cleavage system protein GcvH [Clostridiaceae bacterium]|nr:glycine cleavage system protein GcvH [Clostridiaceae bacterium]